MTIQRRPSTALKVTAQQNSAPNQASAPHVITLSGRGRPPRRPRSSLAQATAARPSASRRQHDRVGFVPHPKTGIRPTTPPTYEVDAGVGRSSCTSSASTAQELLGHLGPDCSRGPGVAAVSGSAASSMSIRRQLDRVLRPERPARPSTSPATTITVTASPCPTGSCARRFSAQNADGARVARDSRKPVRPRRKAHQDRLSILAAAERRRPAGRERRARPTEPGQATPRRHRDHTTSTSTVAVPVRRRRRRRKSSGAALRPRATSSVTFDRSIVHGQARGETRTAASRCSDDRRNDALVTTSTQTRHRPSPAATPARRSSCTRRTPATSAVRRRPPSRNLHLRADAPVNDRGGQPLARRVRPDVDGEPRVKAAPRSTWAPTSSTTARRR